MESQNEEQKLIHEHWQTHLYSFMFMGNSYLRLMDIYIKQIASFIYLWKRKNHEISFLFWASDIKFYCLGSILIYK